jgi:transcriptional regulator with XRE-family HTH domain
MLTEFGKALRKLRLDNSEILKNMAERLSVSSSYLSAIEHGKRQIPQDFISKLSQSYALSEGVVQSLAKAREHSISQVGLDLGNTQGHKRDAALIFARQFDELDDFTAQSIVDLLQRGRVDD